MFWLNLYIIFSLIIMLYMILNFYSMFLFSNKFYAYSNTLNNLGWKW